MQSAVSDGCRTWPDSWPPCWSPLATTAYPCTTAAKPRPLQRQSGAATGATSALISTRPRARTGAYRPPLWSVASDPPVKARTRPTWPANGRLRLAPVRPQPVEARTAAGTQPLREPPASAPSTGASGQAVPNVRRLRKAPARRAERGTRSQWATNSACGGTAAPMCGAAHAFGLTPPRMQMAGPTWTRTAPRAATCPLRIATVAPFVELNQPNHCLG